MEQGLEMIFMKIGYIRVSTNEQKTIRQEILMKELGVDEIYIDKISGKNTNRPQLKAMLDYVRHGDTVIVSEISRFARNTKDLLELVEALTDKGVEFVSKKEAIDTTTPTGKFMLTVFGAVAELEREYILHNILVKGLISCPKKNDTKCLRVNFLEENGEAELILNEIDCQELAYAYLKLKNGSGFKRCRRCGRLMNGRNKNDFCQYCVKSSQDGNHIWCIDCGDEVEINQFDAKTCRCKECQDKALHKMWVDASQKYRNSKNYSS